MARRRPRGWHRQVRRKFVWDRTRGFASSPDAYGVDLLANFRSQPGATHLGATVTRIRGYVWPDAVGGEAPANPYLAGAIGFRIDAWNEDPLDVDNNPFAQPDEDWMGWLPYFHYRPCRCRPAVGDYLERTGLSLRRRHQGTEEAGRAEPDSLDVLHSSRGRCHHVQLGPQYRSEAALTRLTACDNPKN